MVELKGRLDITDEIISELEDASKFYQNATQRGNNNNNFEREFKEYDQNARKANKYCWSYRRKIKQK